jgi:hypothetical protein
VACTEAETIEVATEAKLCNGVGEPVMQLEALGDQQATPSSMLSISKVSLCILYLLKNKITPVHSHAVFRTSGIRCL